MLLGSLQSEGDVVAKIAVVIVPDKNRLDVLQGLFFIAPAECDGFNLYLASTAYFVLDDAILLRSVG
ncbi:MAG: hypothetical protein JWM11_3900 [Planctomycetaceae bacterium]|nr:hypothetical protein [Planctomycetaceae bacterium]